MPKPKPIYITLNNPCSQNWDEMVPHEQGRYCNSCQKVVTDFSGWTDTALYNFFIQNGNKEVCGRFKDEQLNRSIIPFQPQSRLYKMFIGFGLTLVLLHAPVQQTFAKPPYMYSQVQNQSEPSIASDTVADSVTYIDMKGVVLTENGEPITGAIIRVERHNVPHYVDMAECGAITDVDGSFFIRIPLLDKDLNAYILSVDHNNYSGRIVSLRDYIASEDKYVQLKLKGTYMGGAFIREWYRPVIASRISFIPSFLEDEIKNCKP